VELDAKEVESAKNLCAALCMATFPALCTIWQLPPKIMELVGFNKNMASNKSFLVTLLLLLVVAVALQVFEPTYSWKSFWKGYTRPQILAGKYPLPVHRQRKIYFVSVRDLGRNFFHEKL
jgi:hypothetical protein